MVDEMNENPKMNTINSLSPNQVPEIQLIESAEPTWSLVWKTIVTGGYYLYGTLLHWRYIAPDLLQSVKVTKTMLFVFACLWGGTELLYEIMWFFAEEIVNPTTNATLLVIHGFGVLCSQMISLVTLLGNILAIVMAFKLKHVVFAIATLCGRENLRINGFYLFLFHLFYINYILNSLKKK